MFFVRSIYLFYSSENEEDKEEKDQGLKVYWIITVKVAKSD